MDFKPNHEGMWARLKDELPEMMANLKLGLGGNDPERRVIDQVLSHMARYELESVHEQRRLEGLPMMDYAEAKRFRDPNEKEC